MKTTFKEKIQKIIAVYVVGLMLLSNVTVTFADDGVTDTTTQPAQIQTESQPTNAPAEPVAPITPITPITPDQTPIQPETPITPAPLPTATPTPSVDQQAAQTQPATDSTASTGDSSGGATASTPSTTQPKKNKNKNAQSNSQPTSANTTPSSNNSSAMPQIAAAGASISDQPSGAAVVNSGNGEGSTNTGSSSSDNTTNTNQNNSANVSTSLNQSATTGDNRAHDNIGGDTTVASGDANVSGTAITAVNTNVDNVAVSEFNVNDVQNGDLILDSASHCISGCGSTAPNVVVNSGNGADSTNTASSTTNNTDNTFQNNDATVGTDMTLVADSGHNRAHDNIGGDTSVTSGDANVSANAVTLANNNIEGGKVQYNVVNIYGELHGDIVLPEEEVANTSAAMNTGNGANSTNTASNTTNNTSNTTQGNNASINNNLNIDAATGDNYASDNGGAAKVESGNTNVVANVLNVANSNIDGDTMWLVIVNEAGKWVGKILGGDGSNMSGSEGTEFIVNDDGTITASNNGNGAGSTNTASSTTNNTENTTQTNNATINNNLNLSANTGDNRSHDNLGGSNTVQSGDATIIANLINFVNNNIKGNGKLIVTVVNVFGKWFGDFVAPGQTKTVAQTESADKTTTNTTTSDNSNNQPSTTTETTQSQTAVLGASATNSTPTTHTTTGGSTLTIGNKNGGSTNVLIAGANTLVKGSHINTALTNNMHQISVNLAWMILMLPVLGVLAIGRKIIRRRATA